MASALDLNANRGPYLFWVCVVLIVLSTLAVVLRFVARKAARLPFLFDDWAILIALVILLSLSQRRIRKANTPKPCVLSPCILDLYGPSPFRISEASSFIHKFHQAYKRMDLENTCKRWVHQPLWMLKTFGFICGSQIFFIRSRQRLSKYRYSSFFIETFLMETWRSAP